MFRSKILPGAGQPRKTLMNGVLFLAPWLLATGYAEEAVQAGLSVRVPSAEIGGREKSIPASAAAISLKRLDVTVDIEGMTARTTVTSVYQNDGTAPAKAMLCLPLPRGAALDRFAMTLADESELIEGTVEEKTSARAAFRRIVDDPVTQTIGRSAQVTAAGATGPSGINVPGQGPAGVVSSGGAIIVEASNNTVSSRGATSPDPINNGLVSATGALSVLDASAGSRTVASTGSISPTPRTLRSTTAVPDPLPLVSWPLGSDPGILELSGRNGCRATFFPIEPSRTKTVVFAYTQSLAQPLTSADSGTLQYAFPLAAFQSAANDSTHVRLSARSGGVMQMELARPIQPRLALGQEDVTASVEFVGKDRLRGDWGVTVQPSVAVHAWETGCAVQAHRPDANRPGLFATTLVPNCPTAPQPPSNVIFIVDASCNRTPAERGMACDFMAGVLAKMPPESSFSMVALDRAANLLPGGWLAPTAGNAKEAIEFLGRVEAVGNGDLVTAFGMVKEKFIKDANRNAKLVYIGDLRAGESEGRMIQQAATATLSALNAELFAVRPCSASNGTDRGTDELLKLSGSPVADIVPGMDATLAGNRFAAMLDTPVVRNAFVVIKTADGREALLTQKDVGGLPAGRATTLLGTYAQAGHATVTLNGLLRGKPFTRNWTVSLPETQPANGAIARLWARAASDAARSEMSGFEATQSALKQGIAAGGTAFLVTENHKAAQSRAALPARTDNSPSRSECVIGQPAP